MSNVKRSFIPICLFAFALVLLSCKKQESEINRNSISLIVMEPRVVDTSGFLKNYMLKGAVVAPGSVDFKEYGFVVSGGGTVTQYMSLGSGEKAGVIEAPFGSPFKYENLTILLYGVLANGDTLTSKRDGDLPPSTPEALANGYADEQNYEVGGPNVERFTGKLYNNDVDNFIIVEQGIEYAPQLAFEANPGTFTESAEGSSINTSEPTVSFLMEVDTEDLFASKTAYYFRIYFIVENIHTHTTSKLVSGEKLFTSQTIAAP